MSFPGTFNSTVAPQQEASSAVPNKLVDKSTGSLRKSFDEVRMTANPDVPNKYSNTTQPGAADENQANGIAERSSSN